jgi:hypothetical protein
VRELTVDWDAVTPADLAKAGTLTVRGDLSNGAATRATAVVTITAVPTEPEPGTDPGTVTPSPGPSVPGTPGVVAPGEPNASAPAASASNAGGLARTGLEILLPSALGSLLLAAGIITMIARKRRRSMAD